MKLLHKRWATLKINQKNKKACIEKFNEGGKSFANIKCAFNAILSINNSGILYNTPIISEYFFIPIENIRKVKVKTDQQLTKKISDNKVPIIGNLTFPRESHFFLIISYVENNLQIDKMIESKMASEGLKTIIKAKQNYIKNHPNISPNVFDYALEASYIDEDSNNVDIPDQINKLYELVEKGALSLEEFNQKKIELLARM